MNSHSTSFPGDISLFADPEALPDRGDLDQENYAKVLQVHANLTQDAIGIVLHSQPCGNRARRDASVLEFHDRANAIRLPVSMRNFFLLLALTTRGITKLYPILDLGDCVRQPGTRDLLAGSRKRLPISVFTGPHSRTVLSPRSELTRLRQRERSVPDLSGHRSIRPEGHFLRRSDLGPEATARLLSRGLFQHEPGS